jgi:hypothetical protein
MTLALDWPIPTVTGLLILAWLVLLGAWVIALYISGGKRK